MRRNLTGYIFKLNSFTLLGAMALAIAQFSVSTSASAQTNATVLNAAEATKLLPASVFFRGQSATTQLRNSGGVKFSDGMFTLAVLVDTSGYSSDVQQKYQAYFITEVPLKIEGHDLVPGIYGVGFIADNKFNVLDVGAHDLFVVASHPDADLKRPMPLKVTSEAGSFRLYEGRNYISFTR